MEREKHGFHEGATGLEEKSKGNTDGLQAATEM